MSRTLPVSFGDATTTLKVVRVLSTKRLRGWPLDGGPGALLASEEAEIVVRVSERDYLALNLYASGDSIPYARLQFGDITAEAMLKRTEQDMRSKMLDELLLTFLLLRVSPDVLEFDDDWERDEEHCYLGELTHVTAMRPKQRLETDRGEWQSIGTSDTGVVYGERPKIA